MPAPTYLNGPVAVATMCIAGLLYRAWRRHSRLRLVRRIGNRLDRA